MPPRHVGILLFDDVEDLDAVGPWQVFADWVQSFPEDGWTASCFSRDGEPVRTAKGLRLIPDSDATGLPSLGVLRGQRATTHWSALELLGELDPTISVVADTRFVDLGETITSAGVSAGIDMALHLVARLAGPERAEQVRHEIQYEGSSGPG